VLLPPCARERAPHAVEERLHARFVARIHEGIVRRGARKPHIADDLILYRGAIIGWGFSNGRGVWRG
jgi:hypothetical protein